MSSSRVGVQITCNQLIGEYSRNIELRRRIACGLSAATPAFVRIVRKNQLLAVRIVVPALLAVVKVCLGLMTSKWEAYNTTLLRRDYLHPGERSLNNVKTRFFICSL